MLNQAIFMVRCGWSRKNWSSHAGLWIFKQLGSVLLTKECKLQVEYCRYVIEYNIMPLDGEKVKQLSGD